MNRDLADLRERMADPRERMAKVEGPLNLNGLLDSVRRDRDAS